MRTLNRVLLLPLLLPLLIAAPAASAQTVQYRSREWVEYRSLPDTGPIARAQAALAADPRNVQRYLDLGAAQSGARQFREAIDTYTRGLAIDSTNAMLYRWRGHRQISVREYSGGHVDLMRALALDSTNYGAHYHIGVVRFVTGEYRAAAFHFAKALLNPPNPGETAGSTDWLWMSLQRMGMRREAEELLSHRPDSVPANNAYATRLALYRGEIPPDSVFKAGDTTDTQVATLAYGLGNWYLLQGDTAAALRQFERAVRSGGWPAFGFMAAESELRRLRWARSLPNHTALEAYLRTLNRALNPLRLAEDTMVKSLRARTGTESADSLFWRFRRVFAGQVDGVASRIEDSAFAVRVDPRGAAAVAARRIYGRELAPVPRELEIMSAIRQRLALNGVWVVSAEGSIQLARHESALLEVARRHLTPAGVEAGLIVAEEQLRPAAADGSIQVSLDTLGSRLARAERFVMRNGRHVAADEVGELLTAYRRFFLSGNENTSHFDRETGEMRVEVREAFARFVTAHPDSRVTRDVNQLMAMLAQSGFRRTAPVDAWLRSLWR